MSTEILDICERSPSYVRAIAPYEPGRPISEVARELGLDERTIVKLASNENPLGVSPRVKAAIERELPEIARYPDGNAFTLKAALSAHHGLAPEGIVVGNGSNDVLEAVAAAFLAPGRAAVFSQHAFAVYPLATQARGAQCLVIPAEKFGHDLQGMLAAVTPQTRVVFIANPNNPTGTFVSGRELSDFLGRVPSDVVVVLDEAYTEYLPAECRYDSVSWLKRHRNLVVTRTFSKAYGLAGLRVGYGLCDPKIADLLNRVRQPFNVNSLALAAAVAALADREFVEKGCEVNRSGMRQLTDGFSALGLEYIASVGNFVSFRVPRAHDKAGAGAVFQSLLRRGVIVRPVGGYGMPDHLRVTVGLPEENKKFLEALKVALAL